MTDIIKNGTMIIPTAETIEQNKALVQKAVEQVAEWFSDHPGHFQAMAETIGQMNQDYEKEYERLNPPLSPEESNNWPHTGRKEKKPDLFNPIYACHGKPLTQQRPLTYQTERITRYLIPKEHLLMTYYTVLIGLHDGMAIIRDFPDPISKSGCSLHSWCRWLVIAAYCPEMMDDDRAAFIKAALLAVKNDLDTQPTGGEAIPDINADTNISLKDFIKEYCKPLSENLRDKCKEALQRKNTRKENPLNPKLTPIYHESGCADLFLPSYLIKNWKTWQDQVKILPDLRPVS